MEYFIKLNNLEGREVIKGGVVSFFQTENLTLAFTDMKAGMEIPLHYHAEEAIDIVIEGQLTMQIGGVTDNLGNGMVSAVPSNVPHKAKAITDCKVVTIFHPQRKL